MRAKENQALFVGAIQTNRIVIFKTKPFCKACDAKTLKTSSLTWNNTLEPWIWLLKIKRSLWQRCTSKRTPNYYGGPICGHVRGSMHNQTLDRLKQQLHSQLIPKNIGIWQDVSYKSWDIPILLENIGSNFLGWCWTHVTCLRKTVLCFIKDLKLWAQEKSYTNKRTRPLCHKCSSRNSVWSKRWP